MEVDISIPYATQQPNPYGPREYLQKEVLYKETKYRWAILALVGAALLLNGLVSFAIVPI